MTEVNLASGTTAEARVHQVVCNNPDCKGYKGPAQAGIVGGSAPTRWLSLTGPPDLYHGLAVLSLGEHPETAPYWACQESCQHGAYMQAMGRYVKAEPKAPRVPRAPRKSRAPKLAAAG